MRVARFLHGKQDAAVHRFQPIAQVGNGTADDHAHRVIEVGRLHFIDDVDLGAVIGGAFGHFACGFNVFRGIAHVTPPCCKVLYFGVKYLHQSSLGMQGFGAILR